MKPSKLIRLGGVPETATKDDVSQMFLIRNSLQHFQNFYQVFLNVPFLSLANVLQMVCHVPQGKSRFRSRCNVIFYLVILGLGESGSDKFFCSHI